MTWLRRLANRVRGRATSRGDFDARVRPLRRALQLAADDLGVRVTTDGAAIVDEKGCAHPLVAVIHDFGGGMYVFEQSDGSLMQLAFERGHGVTVLRSGYESYERATFIEALNDWGWTGDTAAPDCYVE